MWALLFPNNKAAKERREECIKLAVVETSIKVLAAGKAEEATPALGILSALVEGLDQCRQVREVWRGWTSVDGCETKEVWRVERQAREVMCGVIDSLQIFLDNKPAALPHLLKAFNHESAAIKAAASSESKNSYRR
jgi:hypothetical protein